MSVLPPSNVPPSNVPPPLPPLSPPPLVPPPEAYQPAFVLRPRRTVWPTVIGIIDLCLTGMGVLGLFVADLIPPLVESLAHLREATQKVRASTLPVALVALVMLAVSGVLLLKRRKAVRYLMLAYAIAAIVNVVLWASLMHRELSGTSMDDPRGLFNYAYGLVFPVFLLIWFLRPKIADEMKTWK